MSDVNLFSSKTDSKKLLFTTEKFHLNDDLSTDSWQDLSEQAIPDYSTVQKVPRTNCKSTDYSRLDRWLLLPPAIRRASEPSKRLSKESIPPTTEHTFPDSCESLTVSVDLHVPTDELMTDYDEFDGQDLVVWRNKLQQYRNFSSTDAHSSLTR